MEFVPEVTAFLENKPGRLAKICSALAQEKVDIRALSVMATEGPSVLRFVTTDVEATKAVLTSLGTEFRIDEVLAVPMENRTGRWPKSWSGSRKSISMWSTLTPRRPWRRAKRWGSFTPPTPSVRPRS